MKKLFFAASLLGVLSLSADDLLSPAIESFSSDGEGDRYFSNHFNDAPGAGTADFWERVTSNPTSWSTSITGFDGAMWACEDPVTDVTAGILTLATIVGAGDYSNRVVEIDFAEAKWPDGRFEVDDEVLIQVAFDGDIPGALGNPAVGTYTTIGRLVDSDLTGTFGGFHLEQDTNNNGSAADQVGQQVTNSLATFSFPIPDGGGADMSIRIRADLDGGSEELAFDNITVTGDIATTEIPVLATIEGSALTFTEGGSPSQITNALTISDLDSSDLTGATVSITSSFDTTEDVLVFSNQLGITGSYSAGSGVLTLSGTTTLANYQTALRTVTYDNTDNSDATMATRTISFKVTDDQSNMSLAATRDVDVNTALNPASPLSVLGYCESFESNGEGTRYGSNHAVLNLASDYFDRFDTTSAVPSGYLGTTVAGTGLDGDYAWISEDTVSTTGGTGMVTLAPLTVTGFTSLDVSLALEQARTGDLDQWENSDFVKVLYSMDGAPFEIVGAFYGDDSNGINGLLREDANLNGVSSDLDGGIEVPASLTDFNFSIPITGDTLEIRVEVRCTGSEEVAFDNICVNGLMVINEPPLLAALEGSTISYAEGSGPVALTSALTVSDIDDTDLESALVEFMGNWSQTQDELQFTNQNGISGVYDGVAGELTLTGTSSVANYQTALRSVKYFNSNASDAAPGSRTIRFSVHDGDSGSNLDQSREVNVTTTLDPPAALTSSGYCESFETDGAGTRYASNHATSGGSDVFERFEASSLPAGYPGGISGALDADWLWVAEDTQSTVGGEGIIDLQTQIVSGWADLEVSFALGNGRNGEDRFEHDDYVKVGYSMDGGPFTVVGAFYGNNPAAAGRLVQDSDLDGSSSDGDGGTEVPTALTSYTFPITETGTNLVVGVRVSSAGSEEIAFDNICLTGTDVEPPVADLAIPSNGSTIGSAVINGQGYLDVTFNDNGDLNLATITDVGSELSLSGAAAGSVSLTGSGVLQAGTTYRYSFSGDFAPGVVSVNFIAGSFADDAANLNVSELESFTVTNSPPVAGIDVVSRHAGASLKIPVATLLSTDSDPDGNPLSITAVSSPTTNGATITHVGSFVFYNPNGFAGPDSFTYTLEDSLGGIAVGTVNVTIINDTAPSQNITGVSFPGNGTAVVAGAGIPGRLYRVQVAGTGSPNSWSDYGTTLASPTNGVINYVDPGPMPPTRLYRFVYP